MCELARTNNFLQIVLIVGIEAFKHCRQQISWREKLETNFSKHLFVYILYTHRQILPVKLDILTKTIYTHYKAARLD